MHKIDPSNLTFLLLKLVPVLKTSLYKKQVPQTCQWDPSKTNPRLHFKRTKFTLYVLYQVTVTLIINIIVLKHFI